MTELEFLGKAIPRRKEKPRRIKEAKGTGIGEQVVSVNVGGTWRQKRKSGEREGRRMDIRPKNLVTRTLETMWAENQSRPTLGEAPNSTVSDTAVMQEFFHPQSSDAN